MKILSIDNFSTKFLSKQFSKLLKRYVLGSLVVKLLLDNFFIEKTVFHVKILSINYFTTKLLSIKDYFLNSPQQKDHLEVY